MRRDHQQIYDRLAHLFPFAADVHTTEPITIKAAHWTLIGLRLKGNVTRYRFPTRSERDRFVHHYRDQGARNA